MPAPASPSTSDPAIYAASDLDHFPSLRAALDLDRLVKSAAATAPAAIRLDLVIDENGVVREVAVADADAPDTLEQALRALFARTRFVPARKGGRAVKSRITLQVDLRPGDSAQ